MRRILVIIVVVFFVLIFCPSAVSDSQLSAAQYQGSLTTQTGPKMEAAADAFRINKEYEKAITLYREAIGKDRRNAVLYNKMGIAELQTSDFAAAKNAFGKAAKLNRTYAEPLNNRAVVAYIEKDYRKAVKLYRKAIALDPNNASFHNNLGTVLFAQHKTDDAIKELLLALQLDPEVLARSERGGVAAQISALEERAEYSYMLAKLHARLGDVDRCLECLRKAKEAGYSKLENVYKDPEFQAIRQDSRLATVVPAPTPR